MRHGVRGRTSDKISHVKLFVYFCIAFLLPASAYWFKYDS